MISLINQTCCLVLILTKLRFVFWIYTWVFSRVGFCLDLVYVYLCKKNRKNINFHSSKKKKEVVIKITKEKNRKDDYIIGKENSVEINDLGRLDCLFKRT